jgi:hypothetical protein
MKKTYMLVFLALAFFASIIINGCESSSTTGTKVIRGNVKDSTANYSLADVLITTVPSSSNGVTDSAGNFVITGVEEGSYVLTFKKDGYYSKSLSVLTPTDTTELDSVKMFFINLWVFNGLTVSEYFDDNSYSAVNLYLGQVVQETNNANKDIQLRDSSGTSANFFFRSADLALMLAGNQTKFSAPLTNPRTQTYEFMKSDFDTLSRIQTIGPNITEADFPNDRTWYFNAPLYGTDHKVYAFYLKGRGFIPPTFGMFYLNFGTRDTLAPGQPYKFTIDVKVNKNGLNEFNPNAYSK